MMFTFRLSGVYTTRNALLPLHPETSLNELVNGC